MTEQIRKNEVWDKMVDILPQLRVLVSPNQTTEFDALVTKLETPGEEIHIEDVKNQIKEMVKENLEKEHERIFPDGYGKEQIEPLLERITEFEGVLQHFVPEQISRLAALDVCDPGFDQDDPERPATHFEDAYQMATFVDQNYDDLNEQFGLGISREVLIYSILNHDIGKSGEHENSIISRIFNIKDEGHLAYKKYGGDPQGAPTEFLKKSAELQGGRTRGVLASLEDFAYLADIDPQDAIEEVRSHGITETPVTMASVFRSHESWSTPLNTSLGNIESLNEEEKQQVQTIAVGHHNDRHRDVLVQAKETGTLNDVQLFDIIDKYHAFLTRKPPVSQASAIDIMISISKNKHEDFSESYIQKIYGLFPEIDFDLFEQFREVSLEIGRLQKEREKSGDPVSDEEKELQEQKMQLEQSWGQVLGNNRFTRELKEISRKK